MEYREYGKTGLRLSRLGLGAMRLPQRNGRVDDEAAAALVCRALERGVNVIDTAFVYPGSEEAVGRGIAGRDRAEFFIQTKAPLSDRPGEARRALEKSLARLGTPYVDFFLAHDARLERMAQLQMFLDEARRAQDEGLVRHVGFSSHDTPANIICLIDTDEFECMLVQFSLLDTSTRVPLGHARLKGLGVSVMGPLAGGRLVAPAAAFEGTNGDRGLRPSLRFVMANEDVHVAFSGVSEIEHLEENVAIFRDTTPLSSDERERVALTAAERKKLADFYCTGCGYCMPCPNGVNVPEVFRLAQYIELYGIPEYAREVYRKQMHLQLGADQCMRCFDCEPKCPQSLKIRDLLSEAHLLLGGEEKRRP